MNDIYSLKIGRMIVSHFLVAWSNSIRGKYINEHAIKYRYLYIIPLPIKNRSLNIYQLISPMIYWIESYAQMNRVPSYTALG